MKRMSAHFREENYEHVLMCLICRSLFDDYDHQPKFLPCHHTFCKDCLKEYIKQTGDEIECPSCRKIATIPSAGVTALQTNFYVKYIQGLVQGSYGFDRNIADCSKHPNNSLTQYCKECQIPICAVCCKASKNDTSTISNCAQHEKISLTAITEECHQALDTSFSKANALIERKKVESEALLKALCQEKDQALLKIDSTFEQHLHTINRRATLLKNKVIDIYNEHVSNLEANIEETSTAMTCVVSLKEYHERKIGQSQFQETEKGISELEEVFYNISEKINPSENHIVFEDNHGIEKFKIAAKDLGRVKSNRPIVPRTEPEGGRDTPLSRIYSQPVTTSPSICDPEVSPFHVASGYTQPDIACGQSIDMEIMSNIPKLNGSIHAAVVPSVCDQLNTSTVMTVSSNIIQEHHQCDTGPVQQKRPYQLQSSVHTNHDVLTGALKNTNKNIVDSNANENVSRSGENSATDPNSNEHGQLIVRPKSLDTKNKARKERSNTSSSRAVKSKQNAGKYHDHRQEQSKCNLNDAHRNTMSSVREELTLLRRDDIVGLPDIEALKKADKSYHQLVYTSYDEEELLKELKTTRITLNDPNVNFVARNMSESDSWMTASSVEEMVLSTGDDTINLQQSSF